MNPRDVEDIYDLSPLQSGMLFHTLFEPESKLYFEQIVVPVDSAMSAAACEQAWNHVVADNTALRTSFHWQQLDKPVQVVHRSAQVPLATVDLRALGEHERSEELRRLVEEDRRRGFDLERAPLLRATLVHWTPSSSRLVLSFHHMIMDGWSMQHVVGQFIEAYQSFYRGTVPARRRSRPYGDYIRWLQTHDRNASAAYWKKKLGDLEGPCLLPADAEASANGADFAEHVAIVPPATMTRLRELSARRKLTLNTIVQGAWALLVADLTGADDIVFGVTVSGRPAELPDVESMVGMFINTVPLRIRVRHEATVTEWLRALQQEQFEARQFDHTPLVQVREASGFAGREMFDTLFAFENYASGNGTTDAHGAAASFIERTNYTLSAVVVPRGDLEVRLLYRTGLLSTAAVRRIGERYGRILESIAASPDAAVGSLDTLTAAEEAWLERINDTETEYPREATVTELVDEAIAAHGDAIAIRHGDTAITYAELDARADALAGRLADVGVKGGDRVGLLFERSIDAIVAMLAVLRRGAAYVPIDTAYPPARVEALLADTGITVVLSPQAVSETAAPAPRMPRHPLSAAYVMFTSGSTGKPKGLVIPDRAIIRLVRNTNYIEFKAGERVANASNGAFDAATFEIWGALMNGASLEIIDRETLLSPQAFARTLRERQIDVVFVTTPLFHQIVEEVPAAFATVRVAMAGGDAFDPRVARAVLQSGAPKLLLNGYGPTESTTFAVVHSIDDVPPGATTVPIGRPISNTTAYILDGRMRPVAPGGTGELFIGGDGLAHGYHGRPALAAERFLPDPFSSRPGARMYRTGDKVRWRADGTIDFLGRFDRQLKVRGYRVELGEIEFRVLEHPAVAQAFVAAREDGNGTRLIAWVVPREHAPQSWTRDLRNTLLRHLPEYMQPALVPLAAMPLNSNGKIDADALPVPAAERETEQTFVAPSTDTERRLAQIWQQLLGIDRVGVHDVFFNIGGHSLRATQLVSRVRRELGVELPLRDVFEHPTVAELARLVDSGRGAPAVSDAPDIIRVSRDKHRVAPQGG